MTNVLHVNKEKEDMRLLRLWLCLLQFPASLGMGLIFLVTSSLPVKPEVNKTNNLVESQPTAGVRMRVSLKSLSTQTILGFHD